jgi:DUF177 domain-containing protein
MANLMLQREPPEEFAARGQVIETTSKISDFGRLSEIIAADLRALPDARMPQQWRQVPVHITLRFGWVEARPGIPALEGQLSTTVAAVCQRCLDPLELALDVELKLLLPQTGISPAEYEGFEIWEFDQHEVRPADIVEEALIMALPFSALHKTSDDCVRLPAASLSGECRKVRPFEDLQSLMVKADEKN